eukprot:gene9153-12346_t
MLPKLSSLHFIFSISLISISNAYLAFSPNYHGVSQVDLMHKHIHNSLHHVISTSLSVFQQINSAVSNADRKIPPDFKYNSLENEQDKASIHKTAFQWPWITSVNPDRELSYMPMLQNELKVFEKLGMEQIPLDSKFANFDSKLKPARISSVCFRNEKFRKVRACYFDAGDSVQVFNTLWYPDYQYDLPLLGIDLISLGKNRVLTVIDFQPIHPTEEYSTKYIDHLAPIRNKYPDLQGTLSGKIYDDVSFFSKQMLFGRFTDESKVAPVVLPAFDDYLNEYLKLMNNAIPNNSEEHKNLVRERQAAYDTYNAIKDPAVGLFNAYFGEDWSHSFVHDFLFTLSKVDQHAQPPVHNFKMNSSTGEIVTSTTDKNHH